MLPSTASKSAMPERVATPPERVTCMTDDSMPATASSPKQTSSSPLTAFADENTSLEAAFASGSGPVACSVASLVHDPRASAADRSSRLHKVVVLVIIL
ncbi:hypothetical protein [Alistipes shahii]|uniref:hypothetical protein n=1 Tax=Alistipes shahii TaxID=328814 RepID=UPI00241DF30F|nr:hypothetical protein [Alistipes shahii]